MVDALVTNLTAIIALHELLRKFVNRGGNSFGDYATLSYTIGCGKKGGSTQHNNNITISISIIYDQLTFRTVFSG